MKKLITLCAVLLSTLSFATEFTIEDKANLTTLKMMADAELDLYPDTIQEVNEIAAQYKDAGAFSFGLKRRLKKQNCITVKATSGTNLIMLMTAFEQSKAALEKIDITDADSEDFQKNFKGFLSNVKVATSQCKDISKSAEAFNSSYEQLKEAMDILTSYFPSLI